MTKVNTMKMYPSEKNMNIIKATTKIRIFKTKKWKKIPSPRRNLKEQRFQKQKWKCGKLSTQHKDHVAEQQKFCKQ